MGSSGKGQQSSYQGLSRYGGPSVIPGAATPSANIIAQGSPSGDGNYPTARSTPRSEGAPAISAGQRSAETELGIATLSAMAQTAVGAVAGPVGAAYGAQRGFGDLMEANTVLTDVKAMDRALHSSRNSSLLSDDDDNDSSRGGASASDTSDYGGIGGR